ncbi:MAG: T9SS type A sorting domain-containing protein [candidate division Zixibacteria bacterium]|nr:T9SS type A sorting domain-containing protein [candidate division Zixibacteria bacterium]MCK4607624.1 T9SS type A sorting domain-containing protein [candidate division Zixibacteria bacterium]
MTKRFYIMTVVLTFLLVPSLVFAASQKFAVAEASLNEDSRIVVPLEITNDDNLTAITIPLEFSEGVTLKEVDFEGTRVEYFDLKIATIDDANRTVLIGLLPQMSNERKPDLAAGTGPVANLVFEVTDPTVDEITIEALTIEKPYHTLAFVYHDYSPAGDRSIRVERFEFEPVTKSLSDMPGSPSTTPGKFGLSQNYPNPFNPTTMISFNLPVASRVDLSVYNVLGQKVATLIDGRLDAGLQEVEWNATEFSSGVYFYRIATDANVETRKMVLLK